MNNGLTNSIGWNIGKRGKSNHLFDPLISTPNTGTKARIKIEIKNKKSKNFINLFFSWIEIARIKNNEIETKIRCLMKKKYVCLFNFSDITEVVEEKEKKSPSNKRNINKNKICLSIFLHHFAVRLVFSLPKLSI